MLAAGLPIDPLTALARHPQLLLVVLGGAAWLIKRASAMAASNRPPAGDPRATAEAAARVGAGGRADEDAEAAAERTRQVQAEVRRKIAERRGRAVAPPLVAPRPIARPLGAPFDWPLGRGSRTEAGEGPGSEAETGAGANPFGRSEPVPAPTPGAWMERSAASKAAEAPSPALARRPVEPVAYGSAPPPPPAERSLSADVVARNARVFAAATAASASAPAAPAGAALAAELREPNAARRAIILREILGPPVGLR